MNTLFAYTKKYKLTQFSIIRFTKYGMVAFLNFMQMDSEYMYNVKSLVQITNVQIFKNLFEISRKILIVH